MVDLASHSSCAVAARASWPREPLNFIYLQASCSYIFAQRTDEEEKKILDQFYCDYGPDKEDVEMFKLAMKRLKEEKDELVSDVHWTDYPSDILFDV